MIDARCCTSRNAPRSCGGRSTASFVEVQHFEPVATEDFLSIHVGGDPYVLRLAEIAGLFVDKKITAPAEPRRGA